VVAVPSMAVMSAVAPMSTMFRVIRMAGMSGVVIVVFVTSVAMVRMLKVLLLVHALNIYPLRVYINGDSPHQAIKWRIRPSPQVQLIHCMKAQL
jgi:N-acyl-L-homoserine lactone synthetase